MLPWLQALVNISTVVVYRLPAVTWFVVYCLRAFAGR